MNIHALMPVVFVACGPPTRPPDPAQLDARDPGDDAPRQILDGQPAPDGPPATCGDQLVVTFRDFRSDHPDMQEFPGIDIDPGLVKVDLGADNKPQYAPSGSTTTVAGKASFDQWYRDVPGTNVAVAGMLQLVESPPGTFTYDDQSFFPLDGQAFGNESNPHNYHFTTEIHTTFTYQGGEIFQFTGDDDVFVFVNKRLAVDLGGVHDPMSQTIVFDAQTAQLGITLGGTYQLDVFHAERHTVASTFHMTTTIECLVIF